MPAKFWIGASPDEVRGPYSGVIAGGNIIADDLPVPPAKGERLVVDLHGEAEAWFTVVAVVAVQESAQSHYFQLRIKAIAADHPGEATVSAEQNAAFALGSRIADKAGFSLTGLMGGVSSLETVWPLEHQDFPRAQLRAALLELEQRIRRHSATSPDQQRALDSLAALLGNPLVADILGAGEN